MLPKLCCPCCATPLTLNLVVSGGTGSSRGGATHKRPRTATTVTSTGGAARCSVDEEEGNPSAAVSRDVQGEVGGRSAFELYCMDFAAAQRAQREGKYDGAADGTDNALQHYYSRASDAVTSSEMRQVLARQWLSADDVVRGQYEKEAASVSSANCGEAREAAVPHTSASYNDADTTCAKKTEADAAKSKTGARARSSTQRGKKGNAKATMCAAAVSSGLTSFHLFRMEHRGVYRGMEAMSNAWSALSPASQQRYTERAAAMRTRACMMQRRQQKK